MIGSRCKVALTCLVGFAALTFAGCGSESAPKTPEAEAPRATARPETTPGVSPAAAPTGSGESAALTRTPEAAAHTSTSQSTGGSAAMTGLAGGFKVSGVVSWKGAIPQFTRQEVSMEGDAKCHEKHATPVMSDKLVVNGDKIANVFVYVKSGLQKQDYGAPQKPVILDQVGCMYVPHVIGIMRNQPLKILNSDGVLHNVHAHPKVNTEFNSAMPPAVTQAMKVFDKAEEMFEIKCDVHPWMISYMRVMEHPYFAVTGADGTFEIAGLPAGTYEIEAWQEMPQLGTKAQTVDVGEGKEPKIEFVYEPPQK